ncbi:unnamed protein product [Paramecium octaurelia]|uniref:Autophagy-related protein n=1 Tax=Paramecium octaurelia TaxID=43137 RepID=A0A8S1VKR8_PAROT|nr:unnamed protein product [Paramecium octaurelia]
MNYKSPTYNAFRETFSLEERKTKYQNYKLKYPSKVPMIIQRKHKCYQIFLDRPEVLLEEESTGAVLMQKLQEQLKEKSLNSHSFYIFCTTDENKYVTFPLEEKLKYIAEKYKDKEDEFLYLRYDYQDTFG